MKISSVPNLRATSMLAIFFVVANVANAVHAAQGLQPSAVRLSDGTICNAEVHWYEAHGIGRKELKAEADMGQAAMRSNGADHRYVLCVKNDAYPASLEVRKIYQALPDPAAVRHGLLRVLDESGEDYLYPKRYFVSIEVPKAASQIFSVAT